MNTISKEIKEKIIASYYGELCLAKLNNLPAKQQLIIDADLICTEGKKHFLDIEILVKSLYNVSDEDIIELCAINGILPIDFTFKEEAVVVIGKRWIENFINGIYPKSQPSTIHAYQFLKSKGYALPYLDYSVEDLVELGIYKII